MLKVGAISWRLVLQAAALALLMSFPARTAISQNLSETALWDLLKGGHVAVMRHALAPGSGDPSNFQLDDCATQRNLSDRGRREAMQVGANFREHGIREARIYSSQWCRCLETGALLGLGPVEPLPILNSFFTTREASDQQTEALRRWILEQDLSSPTILVTHQVNVYELTDVYTGTSDIMVLRPEADGTLSVVGRLAYPKP